MREQWGYRRYRLEIQFGYSEDIVWKQCIYSRYRLEILFGYIGYSAGTVYIQYVQT